MNVSRWRYVFPVIACFSAAVRAQVGGTSVYGFLNLTPSPQVAALGGKVIAVPDGNPALAFYNPALTDSASDRRLSLDYVKYPAGINFGYAAYARSYPHAGTFAAGIHYVNYGSFTEADMTGIITGSFTAAEYAFNFTYSRPLPPYDGRLTAGVNVKPLLSVFERYSSYGLLVDLGVTYRHPDRLFTAAVVLRNMGGQITAYAGNRREAVPFEIQAGMSQQLQHAPFRFSLTLQHLERLRLGTDGERGGASAEEENVAKKGIGLYADELMRHVVLGVECMPFRGLILRGGYNYHRRQEMKAPSRTGMVGFSWGAAIHLSRFRVEYARSIWHLAGASNHFSICIDMAK